MRARRGSLSPGGAHLLKSIRGLCQVRFNSSHCSPAPFKKHFEVIEAQVSIDI